MDIQLADVLVHIDETLPKSRRTQIEEKLRTMDGIVSVHNPDERPHLSMVEFNPDVSSSAAILKMVKSQGVHAELIGL